jgi:hypothetical protein
MRLSAFLLPLVVATAFGLAACGGDDSDDSDDYIADADAICTDAARQTADQLLARPGPPLDEQDFAEVLEGGRPVAEDALAQLEAIEVPDDVSADWDEYLSLRQQRIDASDDVIAAADDPEAFQEALGKQNELGTQATAAASDLGLQACASQLSSDDEEAVRTAEDELTASTDPEQVCNEVYLEQQIEAAYGGDVQKCIDDPAIGKVAEIDISEITGVDGVNAFVELTVTKGPDQGKPLEDQWYYVDGEWRLYSAVILPE